MYLTESFMILLQVFQPVFTKPSFATFELLMTGWIISPRHRYITDLIVSSDSTDNGHFSDYHRFFSQIKGVKSDQRGHQIKGSGLFDEGLGQANLLAAAGTHGRFQVEPTCHGLDPGRVAKWSAPLG